jgi:GNAT superfamily N-acetyltransferase
LLVVVPASDIGIRTYQPGDRDQFAELVSAVLAEYGFSVDPVLESDLEDPTLAYNQIWVATDGERVVGSVAMRLLGDGKVAELKRMYLQSAYRGRGLGQALLHQAVTWAQAQRCRSVALDTSAAMTAAQRLYESAGFVPTGTRTETGAHDSRCEVLYTLRLSHPQ